MKRGIAIVALVLLALASPAAATAKPPTGGGVRVGKIALAPRSIHRRATLLVTVSYPVELLDRRVDLSVFVAGPDGRERVDAQRVSLGAGLPRTPERRRRFTFVHQIPLSTARARAVRQGVRVEIKASGHVDVDHDGTPELDSTMRTARGLASGAGAPDCGTMPRLWANYGLGGTIAKLPACTTPRRWRIASQPGHGKAWVRGEWLHYRPANKFRGTDTLKLAAVPVRGASVSTAATEPVVVRVGSANHAVVRAMGDSVTAGFGYYSNGSLMPLTSLPECKPGSVTLVDACSSNSTTTNNEAKKVEYAPDYGLANNVSWAAQWANEHGITNYKNYAISGSEPVNWASGGSLYETTKQIESEDPDYVLMTIGANPLLDNMLFGIDNMGCAIYADLFGKYDECIEKAFAEIHLQREMRRVYTELVQKTEATIFVMRYHLAIPSTALAYTAFQIAEMGRLMNREIGNVAAKVNSPRLRVVTPPHFNVGIDISPVFPSSFSCSSFFEYKVDGPSVQTDATQDELLALHPLSFCEGPAGGEPPWVISGDTGIHPSATGYTQMASQVPAPE